MAGAAKASMGSLPGSRPCDLVAGCPPTLAALFARGLPILA